MKMYSKEESKIIGKQFWESFDEYTKTKKRKVRKKMDSSKHRN